MWLEKIQSPADVQALPKEALAELSAELRQRMITVTAQNGGHIASSLGVVELTVALLRVLDLPTDHVIWDVGHQAYAYKLLTGRQEKFDTLRQAGGLSGFPKSAESEYDCFIAGHSSTSISAALGMAQADYLQGKKSCTVAVIGDGAMSGGMAYEGMNNAGRFKGNLIVILNDNERSISRSTGAMARYLNRVRNRQKYFAFKDFLNAKTGKVVRSFLIKSKKAAKRLFYPATVFEEMGFLYMGPVDGYDLEGLELLLARAKSIGKPVFVHVQTKKGKGLPFAEANPGAYHGVASFDLKTGAFAPHKTNFSDVFGQELCALAEQDASLCAMTAAMKDGTGLSAFAEANPGRFFDVGIAEEHAVTFAGGLAAGGMTPVFAVYSTFLQRGYDQLIHDLSIEKRHVVLGVDRAGIVGEDGETHQGIYDAAFLSGIPGVCVDSPANFAELRLCLQKAVREETGVAAVRYPRGGEWRGHRSEMEMAESWKLFGRDGDVLLVSYGRISERLFETAERLKAMGIRADILRLLRIAPLPKEAISAAGGYKAVYFAEEGIREGGIGQRFFAELALGGWQGKGRLRAIGGSVPQNSVEGALKALGLDAESMTNEIKEFLS